MLYLDTKNHNHLESQETTKNINSFFSKTRNYDAIAIFKEISSNKEYKTNQLINKDSSAYKKFTVDLADKLKVPAELVNNTVLFLLGMISEEQLVKDEQFSKPGLKKLFEVIDINSPIKDKLGIVLDHENCKVKLENNGLNPEWATKYLDEIACLNQFKIFYQIIGLRNSTPLGKEFHNIAEIEKDGKKYLAIRVNGKFRPIRAIMQNFGFDIMDQNIFNKKSQKEWIYSGTKGLTEKTNQIEPVCTLPPPAKKKLIDLGLTFHKNISEERKKELTCVLQVVTHPRIGYSSNLLKNSSTVLGSHCGLRLVLQDGTTYSTGLKAKGSGFPITEAHIMDIDWEEFRTHEGSLTTTIAIDPKQADAALKYINDSKNTAFDMHAFSSNCVSFGTRGLKKIDVNVNFKMSLTQSIWNALPSRKDLFSYIPGLNPISDRIVWLKDAVTPNFVKKGFSLVGSLALYISKKLYDLIPFSYPIDHSSAMINWMLEQKSTFVAPYNEPELSILPLKDNKEFSEKKIAEWKELYKDYAIN